MSRIATATAHATITANASARRDGSVAIALSVSVRWCRALRRHCSCPSRCPLQRASFSLFFRLNTCSCLPPSPAPLAHTFSTSSLPLKPVICPYGRAWVDQAVGIDVAHKEAECSNLGMCDRATGMCTCFEGFEGAACERMKCGESKCNGHGRCVSMRQYAL